MGEWSKKIGEYGENVVQKFFSLIGWNDLAVGVNLPCISNGKHLNENNNPSESHGVDFLYVFMNPLVSGQLNHIIISSKFQNTKYPNSATKPYRGFMEELITTIECYSFSDLKNRVLPSFQFSNINEVGVLFWLNNIAESNDDLISVVASSKVIDTESSNAIYIMDNKRVAFILEVMKFVKTKSEKFDYFFYYPNTGRNINPLNRQNVGKILPVEYLNSTIIPIRLVNKDNPKEIILFLATVDNFEENDLMRLMGLTKDITTELVGQIIIAFPDYNELNHKQDVTLAKQKFQSGEFTKNVEVINFLNPISVF